MGFGLDCNDYDALAEQIKGILENTPSAAQRADKPISIRSVGNIGKLVSGHNQLYEVRRPRASDSDRLDRTVRTIHPDIIPRIDPTAQPGSLSVIN